MASSSSPESPEASPPDRRSHTDEPPQTQATLREVALYFTRLGFTAFGGPAAHIAMMEQDLVERKRWISRQHFLDTLAATQLVPGPNSTEMAIHMGYAQRGIPGLFVAGACFIIPALLLVLAISGAYVAFGRLPEFNALFYGIQPVIVAIIIQAAYRLGSKACRSVTMVVLAVAGGLLTLLATIDTVWLILGGGLVGILLIVGPSLIRTAPLILLSFGGFSGFPFANALTQDAASAPLWRLALFFLKVGATLMGSGYVLISYIEHDLVLRHGWLTHGQLIDAIAVGQMTPGPVFTTAAFVGYVNQAGPAHDIAAGIIGGVVCALAIFLPSFFIVMFMAPWIPRMRQSRIAGAFLDGVNAVVVGSIAATTWVIFQAAVVNLADPTLTIPLAGAALDVPALLLFAGSTFVLLRYQQLNSTTLIAAGAILGLVVQMIW